MNGTAGRSGLVALGVVGSGLGTIVMLATASRLLTVDGFAVFATWWVVATLVMFPLGVFETLLTRQAVSNLVAGRSPASATTAVAIRAATLVVPTAIALCALDAVLAGHLFDGHGGLGVLLAAFLGAALVQSLERGFAAGNDRFRVVATLLALDGAARAGALVVCAIVGVDGPVGVVVSVCLATLAVATVGQLLLGRGWFGWTIDPSMSVRSTTTVLLLVGSLGPILINNASVPWLSGHGANAAVVGSFSGVLTLSRIPIQLSGAAFGPLLRRFAHAVETGDETREHREYRQAVVVSVVGAVIFVGGFTALGDPVISVFLGSEYGVPTWTYALLGASSAAMMVAVVAQVRAAARERWRVIAYAWMLAAVGFGVTLLGPGGLLLRCALAPALGTAVGLLALVVGGRPRIDQRAAAR